MNSTTAAGARWRFAPGSNPWRDGVYLMLLNAALAALCAGTFLGTLAAVSWFNAFRMSRGARPSADIPFPYPVLFLLYTTAFLAAWGWFGRRLPEARRARLVTALVGSGSLFGLSLMGYLAVTGWLLATAAGWADAPAAGIYTLGFLSTLILLAGLSCVGLILWSGRNPRAGARDGT